MKHLGDISKLHGWEIEPTDIIVGGSPCQDLSVAGKRKGIQHSELGDDETTRSGLFIEQIRIIKEMRDYEREVRRRPNRFIRPAWCIWENVRGAFSSGSPKGEDFRIVLESFAQICDPKVSIPLPEDGKWQPHGAIVGDGWSIAWTTHDASEWCVPQRRARISLIASFNSECAPQVLFECESLQGDFEPCGEKREGTAEAPAPRPSAAEPLGAYGISPYGSNAMKSGNPHSGCYEADTARTLPLTSSASDAHHIPVVSVEVRQGYTVTDNSVTLKARDWKDASAIVVPSAVDIYNLAMTGDTAVALTTGLTNGTGTGPRVLTRDCSVERERTALTFDARGNGDGKTVNTITGDHESRPTDYTAVIIEGDKR